MPSDNAKDEQYVPASVASLVIAHTGMVGAVNRVKWNSPYRSPVSTTLSVVFPGHWGTMQGKIVAE